MATRRKFPLRDLTDAQGQRYIERRKMTAIDEFGNVSTNCPRECDFSRRGDCYLPDHFPGVHCNRMCYWQRVNKDGWLLDRDGFIGIKCMFADDHGIDNDGAIRIDTDRKRIDRDGNPVGWTDRKGNFRQFEID